MAKKSQGPRTPAHPFRGFVDLMSEMNRAQTQWMLRGQSETGQGGTSPAAAYVPPADIFAVGKDLIVRCEVPGVRREDVSITIASGMLTISGQRDSELGEKDAVYYARERVYGAFRRSMLLPEGVDEADVSAAVRNGLLEIRVDGGAAAKPHNIDIVNDDDQG